MATSREYMEFLMEQLSALDFVSYRPMMGEYIIYYREKIAAYVCDGRFLVKGVPAAAVMLPEAEWDALYDGAKKKFLRVDDVDNREFLTALFLAMYDELPAPKLKSRKRADKKER